MSDDEKKNRTGHWRDVGENLFVPAHYGFSERESQLEFIAQQPFAQLVSLAGGDLRITATPLFRDPEAGGLNFIGHIARRNAHCAAIEEGERAVALFCGPDAYISPRWFREEPGVPTWSYLSVQLRGRFRAVRGRDETLSILRRSIRAMEALAHSGPRVQPWTLEEVPASLVDRLSEGVLAFHFAGESIEGVRRLNQDKGEGDWEGIRAGLADSPQRGAAAISELMSAAGRAR
ncbi:FMN-binding negative transcriptional regulator [Microbulbifer halophilus]|uniref:FMN-binding negative transcriptional regulator n=1 Tax=Microbulbifer halophilus TaxID=453963 RepID=A0ABW5ED72_9GAMM|nr:FMN-binding negative transcriptional regulator [Microbulbifer halophilus]MCW8126946.1 FMN-binding negative transcriptional regulator [Microbulbifer halophilus]